MPTRECPSDCVFDNNLSFQTGFEQSFQILISRRLVVVAATIKMEHRLALRLLSVTANIPERRIKRRSGSPVPAHLNSLTFQSAGGRS